MVDGDAKLQAFIDTTKKLMVELYAMEVQDQFEDPPEGYPHGKGDKEFTKAIKGHTEAVEKILKALASGKPVLLASPTGTGKTAVYLTLIARLKAKALIITPRNGLQEDITNYRTDYPIRVLEGKAKMCPLMDMLSEDELLELNGQPPCALRVKQYDYERKKVVEVFPFKDKLLEYPCPDCPARELLKWFRDAEPPCALVVNHGNFWSPIRWADFVIVDEADEVARSITDQVSVFFKEKPPDDIVARHEKAVENVEMQIELVDSELSKYSANDLNNSQKRQEILRLRNKKDKLERKLRKLKFFARHIGNLMSIAEKGRNGYWVRFRLFREDPLSIFRGLVKRPADDPRPDAHLLLVTATPPRESLNYEIVSFYRPMKARVIYVPIENMSYTHTVRVNGKNFKKPAKFIAEVANFAWRLLGERAKFVNHIGNLHTHARIMEDELRKSGLRVKTMEQGAQAESIQEFLNSDSYDILQVVCAEYGYDWEGIPVQFIVKVPYHPKNDPWLPEIKRVLGSRFDDWYAWEALQKIIQASGRNARTPEKMAVTFIVDKQFERVMLRFADKVPTWFIERLYVITPEGDCLPASQVFLTGERK